MTDNPLHPEPDWPVHWQDAGADGPFWIAVWWRADASVAAALYEEWLATADEQGRVSPMLPVLCQWAKRIAQTLEDARPFLDRIIPPLAKCLEAEMDYYDPTGRALPVWPSAEDDLFPAGREEDAVTADLMVLMSNEFAAWDDVATPYDEDAHVAHILDEAEGERTDIDSWLQHSFWSAEEGWFGRFGADEIMRPDDSPAGFFPLVWTERSEVMGDALRMRWVSCRLEDWTPRGWLLFFILLQTTPYGSLKAYMARQNLPAGATEGEQRIWLALRDEYELERQSHAGALCHWLEAHRPLLRIMTSAGGILLAVLLIWTLFKSCKPADNFETIDREARVLCENGDHEAAARLLHEADFEDWTDYLAYRGAAEWAHAGQYDKAAAVYRDIVRRQPDSPNSHLNLALMKLRAGERETALALYREFAGNKEFAEKWSELTERARLAADLLAGQMRLDGLEP